MNGEQVELKQLRFPKDEFVILVFDRDGHANIGFIGHNQCISKRGPRLAGWCL